jgi:OmpA-OmpF porin, OOP family
MANARCASAGRPLDRIMKNTILGAACVFVLAGCGTTVRDGLAIQDPTVLETGFLAGQSGAAGAALPRWSEVYGRIKPREVLGTLQSRLDQLGERKNNYFGYKDQCWLDAAKMELVAGDGWGFVEEALGEAARLTTGLEGSQPLSVDTASLRTVATVRPDLSEILVALHADPRFDTCPQAQKEVACAQVKLMHAGHDAWTRDFDAAQVKIDAILNTVADARHSLANCPALPEPEPELASNIVLLPTDTLFAFNGSRTEAITLDGRGKLDALIAESKGDTGMSAITISGFTDRLGSNAYNMKLSQRRADTVQRYLIAGGVTTVVTAQGFGKASPGSSCKITERRALRRCLAGDRRVELRFIHQGDSGR